VVSVEVGPRRTLYVRSASMASAMVCSLLLVAASGPWGGPVGAGGRIATGFAPTMGLLLLTVLSASWGSGS